MVLDITVCIVLYKNDIAVLKKAINSFLGLHFNFILFLLDNSPTQELKILATDPRIEYIHNPMNPGFGASHNVAIEKATELGSKYHFVVNPDIFFEGDIISPMLSFMSNDDTIGMMMPKILNKDGSNQYLPKLLPSPFSLLLRKIRKPGLLYRNFIKKFELREVPEKLIYSTPIISGCFTLISLERIKDIGKYDNKFFMYFEDWDLSRRMNQHYQCIYFPEVSVFHGYESGANKNLKLLVIFMSSAIIYFNKWGWFFDKERKRTNKNVLSQFN